MKKVKSLIALLVCSLLLMGVGYAWWTDTLVMATTAETGKMDVKFTNDTSIKDKSPYVTASVGKKTGSSTTGLNESDSFIEAELDSIESMGGGGSWPSYYDQARCTIENLYPGAQVRVKVCVKNLSTIPVKYNGVEFTGIPNWLQYAVSDLNVGTELGINETKTFYLTFSVPESETGNQEKSATFDVKFNWKQFNQQ